MSPAASFSLAAAVIIAAVASAPAQPAAAPAQPASNERPARLTRETEQPGKTEKKAEKKPVYDEAADAREQIAEALTRAKKDNKRVLIQWGANWCGWCHILDRTFENDPKVRRTLAYEYEFIHVDIGQFDKHVDVAESYNADFKNNGVPYLTILDADGKVVANQETGSLEATVNDQPGHDAAKVLAFLTEHKADPLNADQVLTDALAKADQEDKRVFLHFGAPWCGWCHRLEAWLDQPAVAQTLAKDFIEIKIDTDRMTNGADLLARYTNNKPTGIPYSVFLEPDGTIVAALVNDKGENLGCPWTDEEIRAFAGVLEKVCRTIDKDEQAGLLQSLTIQREEQKHAAADQAD